MNSAKYKIFLFLICFSLSSLICFAADNEKNAISESYENKIYVRTDANGTITIELSIEDFDTIPIQIAGNRYYSLKMPEGHSPLQKGEPDLPIITKSFIIPENSNYTIRVVEDNYRDYTIPIAPSKGSIRRNQCWDDVSFVFSNTYSQNAFYPSETVITGNPYYIRNIHGNNVQICPFKFNPTTNTLRVFNYLKIEISFMNNGNRGNSNNDIKAISNHFYPLIKHKFINSDYYFSTVSQYTQHGEHLRSLDETDPKMLVVCCDSFVTEMRNFIIHKNNLGIPTTLVKISDIGTTASHLMTYIQNAYNNDNDLTYVLLVGDIPQIPSPLIRCLERIVHGDSIFYYGAADPLLSLVSGNDNYPDIVIGRFSARTKNEVKTMVNRVIAYENLSTSNWFHKGIGIASDEQDNTPYTHGYYEADWEHMRNIRATLLSGHFLDVGEFYDGTQGLLDEPNNPSNTSIINSVNTGVSIINYTGHGDVDRWYTGNFTNSQVLTLNNQDKLPFIFSVACLVGQFNNSNDQCFAETWQRANSSSTGKPTGCIGFYGSSIIQSWSEPMNAQDSFNEQLIDEDFETIGMLCYSAACDMMSFYLPGESLQTAQEMFNAWILFGDPSLQIIPNNNVGKTIFLEGDILYDSTYSKDFIDVHNASIKNNTDIVIDCQQKATFDGEFEVEIESTLLVW